MLLVILNTILLALGVVIIGVSSAAIDKLNKKDNKNTPNLIAYWYATLGVTIATILVIIFMLMGNSAVFINRDTYLE